MEQDFDAFEMSDKIKTVLSTLKPREETVLKMRFGLFEYEGKKHTLREIGSFFGLCATSIRNIERKAMRKIKHTPRIKFLGDVAYDMAKKEFEEYLKKQEAIKCWHMMMIDRRRKERKLK